MQAILNKLHKDEYVVIHSFKNINAWYKERVYEITFEGLLFIANGCYLIEQSEKTKVSVLGMWNTDAQKNMVSLTRVLIVVAILPAALNLVQLHQEFHKTLIPEFWLVIFAVLGFVVGWIFGRKHKGLSKIQRRMLGR